MGINEPLVDDRKRHIVRPAFLAAWWVVAWIVTVATYTFTNDHFARISPARQIARFGELPARDFLEPGYVLTEFASAAVQLIFGDNLLGEILLTASCIATGAVLTIALAGRFAPSRVSMLLIGIAVVLSQPRAYDFDKFFFYPLGILLCWRYAERPVPGRLWLLAACAVVAGMFRYDNGVFVFIAGLVAIVTSQWRVTPRLRRHVGVFCLASLACAIPYLVLLQLAGGIASATDQMVTYARREGARTLLSRLPPFLPLEVRPVYLPDKVQVRWAPATDAERSRLEARYTLHDGVAQGDASARTWLYDVDDASRPNLRALIDDPKVADTHLVDRATARLIREGSPLQRFHRALPLVGHWTVAWSLRDGLSWVYWLFVGIPVAGLIIVWRRVVDDAERAFVLSTAVMSLLVLLFILRSPVDARMGGAAAPVIVLGAFVWRHVHRNWLARTIAFATMMALAVTVWSTAVGRLARDLPSTPQMLADATVSPPPPAMAPRAPFRPVIEYVLRCTSPGDRIFAGWFVPELYYFSQRAFAGGVVAIWGQHWSEARNQHRIIAKMKSERVPIVILRHEDKDFREAYIELGAYLRSNYRSEGPTTFGWSDGPQYTLLIKNDRVPSGRDPVSSMPCFADGENAGADGSHR